MKILFVIILAITVIILTFYMFKIEKTTRLKILIILVFLISFFSFFNISHPIYNDSEKIEKWFSGAFAIVSFYSLVKIEMESWKKKE
ncbi:hypothetical protein [Aureivirga sp. CE67]|uniref:hypothetical protein n=1 Tax=Aureivirga sp. CE67 TaxID=1788983 RepID=UPI0018CAABB7|nr:hypothetical protein [Aureivirga sp. CE67]